MENKTILVVDDTVSNLDILGELLQEYDLIDATNGKDALDIVKEEKIDLILLDIMMPDMDGYEVCQNLKSNYDTKSIPIIFITAKSDEDSIEKAFDVGGSDYVTKPFKPKELLARVRKELKLKDLQNELKLLASTDPMTQLYNRRYFTNVSKFSLEVAKREKQDMSLIILDIDKFKQINDRYGHQVGDNIIIVLADILKHGKRESDIICRYGGDECVMLLSNTNEEGAEVLANKLRKEVESNLMVLDSNESLQFTISVGVSQVAVGSESSIEEGLRRADYALFEAKEKGRNIVCVAS